MSEDTHPTRIPHPDPLLRGEEAKPTTLRVPLPYQGGFKIDQPDPCTNTQDTDDPDMLVDIAIDDNIKQKLNTCQAG